MMEPVSGARDLLQLGLLEMHQQAGSLGIGKKAFFAPYQQGGTNDARPQGGMFVRGQPVRRPRPLIVIELPAIEAVIALADAVAREMKRQFGRQPLVARRKPAASSMVRKALGSRSPMRSS